MAGVTRFLAGRLQLAVNRSKSAVGSSCETVIFGVQLYCWALTQAADCAEGIGPIQAASAVAYDLCEERKYRPTYKRVGQLPRRMARVLRILRDPVSAERDGQVDQTAHTGHNVAAVEAGTNPVCGVASSGG